MHDIYYETTSSSVFVAYNRYEFFETSSHESPSNCWNVFWQFVETMKELSRAHLNDPLVLMQKWSHPPLFTKHSFLSATKSWGSHVKEIINKTTRCLLTHLCMFGYLPNQWQTLKGSNKWSFLQCWGNHENNPTNPRSIH